MSWFSQEVQKLKASDFIAPICKMVEELEAHCENQLHRAEEVAKEIEEKVAHRVELLEDSAQAQKIKENLKKIFS